MKNTINQDRTDYKLVWSEEFDGDTLNDKFWSTKNYMNPEQGSCVVMDFENEHNSICLKDGELILSATKEADGKYYVAPSIITDEKLAFRYGKLEMRAKIPTSAAVFPSLWLSSFNAGLGEIRPTDENANPYTVELDIFEIFAKTGPNNKLTGGVLKWHIPYGNEWTFDRLLRTPANICTILTAPYRQAEINGDEYHIITFEWTPTEMITSCDGKPYLTVKKSEHIWPAEPGTLGHTGVDISENETLFTQPVSIRLNNHMFALDGTRPVLDENGNVIKKGSAYAYRGDDAEALKNEDLSNKYHIDYIRLYQDKEKYPESLFYTK